MSISGAVDREGIRHVGHVVAEALAAMRHAVRAGISTGELDGIGDAVLTARHARSAPRQVYNFPGANCISINDEIVHGIPGSRVVQPGDVVKLDVTAECGGYIADAADTVLVPPVPASVRRLRDCAERAFHDAHAVAIAGAPINAIGRAVEQRAQSDGFSVIRELCGHGVGRTIHEEPDIPNYYVAGRRDTLSDGLVITIEPLLSARPARAVQYDDGWTIATANGSVAVHYEHTIVVSRGAAEIVTQRRA